MRKMTAITILCFGVSVSASAAEVDRSEPRLEECQLSVRTYNGLTKHMEGKYGVRLRTLSEVAAMTEAEVLDIPHFGERSNNELKEILACVGLSYGAIDLGPLSVRHRVAAIRLGVRSTADISKYKIQVSQFDLSSKELAWLATLPEAPAPTPNPEVSRRSVSRAEEGLDQILRGLATLADATQTNEISDLIPPTEFNAQQIRRIREHLHHLESCMEIFEN